MNIFEPLNRNNQSQQQAIYSTLQPTHHDQKENLLIKLKENLIKKIIEKIN
jgi:hypothetical protein